MTGTDWAIERVVRVVDGDTVRLTRSRVVNATEEFDVIFRDRHPDGVSVRLVNVDTPERGQAGYTEARADLLAWLAKAEPFGLRVITYPGGGFDRLLGDVYAGDVSNTATQYLLRECGWAPYVKGA